MEWLGRSFWRGAVKSISDGIKAGSAGLSFFVVQDIKADFLQTFSQIKSTIEILVSPIKSLLGK